MFKSFIRFVELQGLQAAGKTTLARSWLHQYPNVARINRDDLRAMMFGDSYRRSQEPVVVACEMAVAETAARNGYNVVIDDTNLTGSSMWRDLANKLGIKHTSRRLDVSVEEAIRRDATRAKPVGEAAIRATARRAR